MSPYFDRSSPELPAETEQSEDKPQSRDPSPVPDADAAMPADDQADYSVDDDSAKDIIVTPLLDADAVVNLMAGGIPSHDIGWRAEKIRDGIKLVFPEMRHDGVNDEDMVHGVVEARVACASGESDAESIRDFDSGPGKFRFIGAKRTGSDETTAQKAAEEPTLGSTVAGCAHR